MPEHAAGNLLLLLQRLITVPAKSLHIPSHIGIMDIIQSGTLCPGFDRRPTVKQKSIAQILVVARLERNALRVFSIIFVDLIPKHRKRVPKNLFLDTPFPLRVCINNLLINNNIAHFEKPVSVTVFEVCNLNYFPNFHFVFSGNKNCS